MIRIVDESVNKSDLIKKAQDILNHNLGRGEEYATVDDIKVIGTTKSGKTRLHVSYSVSIKIPVGRDQETGSEEYDYDYEYRTTNLDV